MSKPATNPSCIALVPARAGSKRVTSKNIRLLAGHPLLAYTVSAALDSGIFAAVLVSTDSEAIADVARSYGAAVPFLRPAELAGDLSPDIDWVEYTLNRLAADGQSYDTFSILRPTSPFRLPETIRRAWELFRGQEGVDSLRAVEKCGEHPAKMWVLRGPTGRPRMVPLLPFGPREQPWHSTPYQALPEVYVQNASLEIAWCQLVRDGRTIAGETIVPFITEGYEGFDINQPYDLSLAEELVSFGQARLPAVRCPSPAAHQAA